MVNQDGCIVPVLINTIILKVIKRDRGPKKAIQTGFSESGLFVEFEPLVRMWKSYMCGVPALLNVERVFIFVHFQ